MTCRSKDKDSAKILFHCLLPRDVFEQRLQEMRPAIIGTWKEMKNYRRKEGEKFFAIPVGWEWSDKVAEPDGATVEIHFLARGLKFENDLVRAMGRTLGGKWGRQVHLKFDRSTTQKFAKV